MSSDLPTVWIPEICNQCYEKIQLAYKIGCYQDDDEWKSLRCDPSLGIVVYKDQTHFFVASLKDSELKFFTQSNFSQLPHIRIWPSKRWQS